MKSKGKRGYLGLRLPQTPRQIEKFNFSSLHNPAATLRKTLKTRFLAVIASYEQAINIPQRYRGTPSLRVTGEGGVPTCAGSASPRGSPRPSPRRPRVPGVRCVGDSHPQSPASCTEVLPDVTVRRYAFKGRALARLFREHGTPDDPDADGIRGCRGIPVPTGRRREQAPRD